MHSTVRKIKGRPKRYLVVPSLVVKIEKVLCTFVLPSSNGFLTPLGLILHNTICIDTIYMCKVKRTSINACTDSFSGAFSSSCLLKPCILIPLLKNKQTKKKTIPARWKPLVLSQGRRPELPLTQSGRWRMRMVWGAPGETLSSGEPQTV